MEAAAQEGLMRRFVRHRGEDARILAYSGSCSAGELQDGETQLNVEAVARRSEWSLKLGDRVFRVEHLGEHRYRVNGHELNCQLKTELEDRFAQFQRDADGAGARQLEAPMPGRIVKLLVAEGDRVTKGQGLLIVEAMKMENELKALSEGTVEAIRVEEGQGVEKGAVLLTFAEESTEG
jgi:biotin carboxyl carrier protein